MAGTESAQREAVKGAYRNLNGQPAPKWATKVNHMTDEQVTAVYLRLKKQGKVA